MRDILAGEEIVVDYIDDTSLVSCLLVDWLDQIHQASGYNEDPSWDDDEMTEEEERASWDGATSREL